MNLEKNLKDAKKAKKNKAKKPNFFFYNLVKITAAIPILLFLRPKLLYFSGKAKKHKKGVLIVANHKSFYDPVLLLTAFWYRNLSIVTSKELFKSKLGGLFFRSVNTIMVDKENPSSAVVFTVSKRLKSDSAVAIFPEGGINDTDQDVKNFKSGAVVMAHLGKKPILPVYLVKGKKWYNRNYVVIGEEIDLKDIFTESPSKEDIERASVYIKEKEMELSKYFYQKYPKLKNR